MEIITPGTTKTLNDLRQGDTKTYQINFGSGVDITGWVAHFLLTDNLDSVGNNVQVSATAGDDDGGADDILNGLMHLTIEASETATLDPGKYHYALKIDKGGTPNIIETIVPTLDDPNDRLTVYDGLEIT